MAVELPSHSQIVTEHLDLYAKAIAKPRSDEAIGRFGDHGLLYEAELRRITAQAIEIASLEQKKWEGMPLNEQDTFLLRAAALIDSNL